MDTIKSSLEKPTQTGVKVNSLSNLCGNSGSCDWFSSLII